MRLINTRTFQFEEYLGDQIPKYAILSHTWGNEEVSHQQWLQNHTLTGKKGSRKIHNACHVSRRQGIDYLWVDTNCINKDSSAELSEAINSMFAWYQRASICLVYLDDFEYQRGSLARFGTSRWFSRGWTLQELLAPNAVHFYDASWIKFGTKKSLVLEINKVTSIPIQYLLFPDSIRLASVSRRMSWAATRSTTREEDMAYCLLGIFEINMPLLYGEGTRAFIRLQEEIIRYNNDHTIFCWSWPSLTGEQDTVDWRGCLAPQPVTFRDSGDFVPMSVRGKNDVSDFLLTNSGLRINLPLLTTMLGGLQIAVLNAGNSHPSDFQICFCLQKTRGNALVHTRCHFLDHLLRIPFKLDEGGSSIFLAHDRDPSRKFTSIVTSTYFNKFSNHQLRAILPIYLNHETLQFSSIGWDCSPSQIHGAVISLCQNDDDHLWFAQMVGSSPKYGKIEVFFTVWIGQGEAVSWDVVVQVRCHVDEPAMMKQFETKDISLPDHSEFTIEVHDVKTLVRPILIPFSRLLGKKH